MSSALARSSKRRQAGRFASATSGCSAASADSSRSTTTTAGDGTTRCARQMRSSQTPKRGSPHYLESTTRSMRALLRLARGESEQASADALRAEELARDGGRSASSFCRCSQSGFASSSSSDELERATELAHRAARSAGGNRRLVLLRSSWRGRRKRLDDRDAVGDWIEGTAIQSAWNDAALAILDERARPCSRVVRRRSARCPTRRAHACEGAAEPANSPAEHSRSSARSARRVTSRRARRSSR